ncbi:hypothetical protein KC361_g58 [Hortaea werneckii]|nr:hypothetical protein KC361_g58 [Hortaea werneckii]
MATLSLAKKEKKEKKESRSCIKSTSEDATLGSYCESHPARDIGDYLAECGASRLPLPALPIRRPSGVVDTILFVPLPLCVSLRALALPQPRGIHNSSFAGVGTTRVGCNLAVMIIHTSTERRAFLKKCNAAIPNQLRSCGCCPAPLAGKHALVGTFLTPLQLGTSHGASAIFALPGFLPVSHHATSGRTTCVLLGRTTRLSSRATSVLLWRLYSFITAGKAAFGKMPKRHLITDSDDDERQPRKHGKLHVKQTLLNSVRSSAMAGTSSDRWSVDKLWRIGGDLSSLESAVYMDVVRRKQIPARDDEFFRLYVGQADKLKSRIHEHERKMHLEKTLHHRVANDSRYRHRFVVLLELPPAIEDLDKWLNIAEMWKAVEYQTLPRSTLSNPLNQNHGQWAKQEVWKLKESTDPLVREHYEQVVLPAARANWKLGREKMRQEKFVPLINALRERGKDREFKRGPETEDEKQHWSLYCAWSGLSHLSGPQMEAKSLQAETVQTCG